MIFLERLSVSFRKRKTKVMTTANWNQGEHEH